MDELYSLKWEGNIHANKNVLYYIKFDDMAVRLSKYLNYENKFHPL